MKSNRFLPALAVGAALSSPAALALPCAGFDDVDVSSPFCQSVGWARNREVTHGCTSSSFCPDQPVSRLAMATLLSRLDRVLPPTIVDSKGRAFGPLSEWHWGPGWATVFRRSGGEVYVLALFRADAPGRLHLVTSPLYHEFPGCTGRSYAEALLDSVLNRVAFRSYAVAVPDTNGLMQLFASAPLARAAPVTTQSYSSGGVCTAATSTGNLIEVAFVENLGTHYTEIFELR